MTATQAPTPGPLDSESVKLLVKGDLLRIDTGGALYEFVRRKASPSALIVAKPVKGGLEKFYERCRFSFVERPSLAPTAPVEASGSELTSAQRRSMSIQAAPSADDPEAAGSAEPQVGRAVYERIEKLLTTKPQGWERDYLCHLVESVEELGGYDGPRLDGRNDRQAVADFLKLRDESVGHSEVDDAERLESADAILAALRPQPSGETRGGCDRNDVRYGLQLIADEECDEVAASYYAKKALALLSARPLALGGQQGDALWSVGSWLSAALDDPKVCDAMKADIREWFDNGGHVRTTPARAEAQDEGAAGGGVTALLEAAGFYEAAGLPITAERLRSLADRHSAHPSPTPAADAARVRITVEALERWSAGSGSPPKGEIRSLLAALKSTAAKEGGAK